MKKLDRSRIFAALVVAATMPVTAAYSDDVPKPYCLPFFPVVVEIPAPGLDAGVLSQLPERQRKNVEYYRAETAHNGRTIPGPIFVLYRKNPYAPVGHHSLILQRSGCDHFCTGTAVLPAEEETRLVEFSYRVNFASVPSYAPATKDFDEIRSHSFVLFDKEQRNFISFFDVWRIPPHWNALYPKPAQVVRSGYASIDLAAHPRSTTDAYKSCLESPLQRDGLLPQLNDASRVP